MAYDNLSPATDMSSPNAFSRTGFEPSTDQRAGFDKHSRSTSLDQDQMAYADPVGTSQFPWFSHAPYPETIGFAGIDPTETVYGLNASSDWNRGLPLQTPYGNYPNARQSYGQITPPDDDDKEMYGGEQPQSTRRSGRHTKPTHTAEEMQEDQVIAAAHKKGKRGRKSKAQQEEEAKESEDCKENKRQKFLERNRVAASKCRDKKKRYTSDLENQQRHLVAEKNALKSAEAALKEELLQLKTACLAHTDCNCVQIRDYMTSSLKHVQPTGMLFDASFQSAYPSQGIDRRMSAMSGAGTAYTETTEDSSRKMSSDSLQSPQMGNLSLMEDKKVAMLRGANAAMDTTRVGKS
ncbi:hypothetical protein K402DRAFT_418115 [Aulographum hederae CBS 113979]|uniref:BZIP domain-containing protein n=1 Tax=Aulographum hederae CBS 113979 TaxID=1176131 RepID=A0A6G1HAC6_9PEZI|nr:hypothetical protein K402DRAFT_418115 [Aulographum hederae CBS 113979]